VIPYGKQDINQDDINAVINVLKSDFLTQGPKTPLFEKEVSKYCNSQFSVAVNSATSALHIACLALGLKKGDWLWTSANSFVASSNCGLYCGAQVDFVDIDPFSYNICVDALEKKLINAKDKNRLPQIVIPVHFAGQSCDMKKIHKLSKEYGFRVIEDASHAIGGRYKEDPIGCCNYSDITVFSFHPVKIVTTAEGGIATTNSSKLAKKMRLFRSHGITRDQKEMTKEAEGPWYYQQIDLGFNYRMTEIQASLGISQMKRLDNFVSKRHQIKNTYDILLKDLPLVTPSQIDDNYSSMHLYPIKLKTEKIYLTHSKVFSSLRAMGIGVNIHYIPIHTQPYYANMGFKIGDYPVAEEYYSRALSLPMYAQLNNTQLVKIVDSIKKVLK
jgi:UDP-4-amino-4,6-dideoxy-N-acetyl-beta-L-altrosamine transaminase